ncbi:MAG: hypothetical protein V3T40_04560, partial [Nitrososphaerales archaeon]
PASIPGTDFPITEDDYIGEVIYVIPKIGYITRLIQPPVNYIIIAIILAILFFNRTSRTKGEKQDKESSPVFTASPSHTADNLPGTSEEHKDTVDLTDTSPDENIKDDKGSFGPTYDESSKEDEPK